MHPAQISMVVTSQGSPTVENSPRTLEANTPVKYAHLTREDSVPKHLQIKYKKEM